MGLLRFLVSVMEWCNVVNVGLMRFSLFWVLVSDDSVLGRMFFMCNKLIYVIVCFRVWWVFFGCLDLLFSMFSMISELMLFFEVLVFCVIVLVLWVWVKFLGRLLL